MNVCTSRVCGGYVAVRGMINILSGNGNQKNVLSG